MNKPPPPPEYDDSPEWTDEMIERARPAEAVLSADLAAALRKPGRPIGSRTSDRKQVTLRIPSAVIEHFKADGPGWQTRAVEVLEREARRRS